MTTLPATILLLGSGELGKEVAIAAQRLGCRVIACDRYADAPAMQVADVSEVLASQSSKFHFCDLKMIIYSMIAAEAEEVRIGTN